MGMKNEIEEALHAHSVWRKQFKDFLKGRASFDLATISATDQCVFGKWLDNEGHRMIPSALHDEICATHKEFHQIAAGIIQKIKQKRFAEAHEDISQDGSLNQASLRLRELLLKLTLGQACLRRRMNRRRVRREVKSRSLPLWTSRCCQMHQADSCYFL